MTDALESVLLGVSPEMVRLRRDIAQIAPTGVSVLIEGETGTGKELVASALHRLSRRRGAFVAVNTGAIPETLFESHLFGHVRGAFTGAASDHRGFVEEARFGTLFLDEITSTPPSGQAKLLRVLESGKVRPVGAGADRESEFRLCAAANTSLHAEVAANRFRSDLLYRLCGDLIRIPPLRSRAEDIELLGAYFCKNACRSLGRSALLSRGAVGALMRFDWPGNVRQLRTVVERAVIAAERDEVGTRDVSDVLARLSPVPTHKPVEYCQIAQELDSLLHKFAWDTVRVAAELGVSRKTVYTRIQRYDLRIPGKFARRSLPLEGRDQKTAEG